MSDHYREAYYKLEQEHIKLTKECDAWRGIALGQYHKLDALNRQNAEAAAWRFVEEQCNLP